jgi:hypothetical protein
MSVKNIAILIAGAFILAFSITLWRGCSKVADLKEKIATYEGEKSGFGERVKLRDDKITALEGENGAIKVLYDKNKVELDKANSNLSIANGKVSSANYRAEYYKQLLANGGTITNKEFKDVVIALNKELGSDVIVYQNDKIILSGPQAGLVLAIMESKAAMEIQYKAAQDVIIQLTARVALCDGQVTNLSGIVNELKQKVDAFSGRLTIAEGLIGDTKKMLEHPPLALTLKKDIPVAIVTALIGGAVYYFVNKKNNTATTPVVK